jgi:hypothetical protein
VRLINTNIQLDNPIDYHLEGKDSLLVNATINLAHVDAWLFFDHCKPSFVLESFQNNIYIHGSKLNIPHNGRIALYKQGCIIIPHDKDFCPLTTFSESNFKGETTTLGTQFFYSNSPAKEIPSDLKKALSTDNAIQSFTLKKGYMATMATNSDGTGYSRLFIANDSDIAIAELPFELMKKISFIRVLPWNWPSKKGWVGSIDKGQPEGLRYVRQQCDATNSTWYYTWSPTPDWCNDPKETSINYNQEFCPEKWGFGGTWDDFYTLKNSTHLLGYNEPDHSEQSNVSVTKALEEWPKMLETGLRVGSPATTDFSWLYRFMDGCKELNYRVDFVVIHAYWGGLSGKEWYNKLKEVHEMTGRPLWIKEWNNGANWTKESWPSGIEAQQNKQLRDLTTILTVMDTAHFIERYSIYNWVEDKRAIILNGKLTPAGNYYTSNQPGLAYHAANEVVPTWRVNTAPTLSYTYNGVYDAVELKWDDENKEMVSQYILERSIDGSDYHQIAIIQACDESYFVDSLVNNGHQSSTHYYRVKSMDISGKQKTSNLVEVYTLFQVNGLPLFGEITLSDKKETTRISPTLVDTPIIILGTPTYRIKYPCTSRICYNTSHSFESKLSFWNYLSGQTYPYPDTVALFAINTGISTLDALTIQAASIDSVSTAWKRVDFKTPFSSTPALFTTQSSDLTPFSNAIQVQNVDTKGFQIRLRYEEALSSQTAFEMVNYLAATPGKGVINEYTMEIGISTDAVVGHYFNPYTIPLNTAFSETPLFWGQMQTTSDSSAAALRIIKRSRSSVTVFKERETSKTNTTVLPEQVAWMVIGKTNKPLKTVNPTVRPIITVCDRVLQISQDINVQNFKVFSLSGTILFEGSKSNTISVSSLSPGFYIALINNSNYSSFIIP